MNEDYSFEDQYSEPEKKELSLCKNIFDKLTSFINEKRETALQSLNCEKNSSNIKKKALNDYFDFRMNPEDCKVCIDGTDYSIIDLENLGNHILVEENLDLSIVLDSTYFYKDSFSKVDVVLARHNFRLSHDEVSLSHLLTVIGTVINHSLKTQGLEEKMIHLPYTVMSYSESKRVKNDIADFIDVYLQKCCDGIDGYIHKYHLERNDQHISFSERIDDFAAQYFSKPSPAEIHSEYIMDFLKPRVVFSKPIYFDALNSYIIELYNKKNLSDYDNFCETKIVVPTFHELIVYVENNHNNYHEIIENLKSIEGEYDPATLNNLFELNQEDIQSSRDLKHKTELDAMFDNLRRYMWSLYAIVLSLDDISKDAPELGLDTAKSSKQKRTRILNKLCEIFDSYGAYLDISEPEEELYKSVIENERRIAYEQNELFKSFFNLFNEKTYEDIMSTRHKLIEEARSICPEDIEFLDRCSKQIGDRLQEKVDPNELDDIKNNIEHVLNSDGILNNHIIQTLSTAEMLYKKYASPVYSNRGFDYSSISSLYYQAFEEAYNDLIWVRYSKWLNGLCIENQLFTTILQSKWDKKHRGAFDEADVGYGYLPKKQDDWSYYIDYDKDERKTKIKASCMYGSFKEFLLKIEELPEFQTWLAEQIDCNSKDQLFKDPEFLKLFNSFVDDVKKANDNRNNASHGGSEISLDQCRIDRNTVYLEVVRIRDLYLGLIQKLVSILRFRKN